MHLLRLFLVRLHRQRLVSRVQMAATRVEPLSQWFGLGVAIVFMLGELTTLTLGETIEDNRSTLTRVGIMPGLRPGPISLHRSALHFGTYGAATHAPTGLRSRLRYFLGCADPGLDS